MPIDASPSCLSRPRGPIPLRHVHRAIAGLTLPELLAACAVASIVAAIALSIGGGIVHASRSASARAALLDTYQVAIRYAATRGVHVIACPGRDEDSGCRDSIDWSFGWLVFEDRDHDRSRDDGEKIVARFPPLEDRVHLRSTVGRKRLVFQPSGGNAGSNATFTLCDARGAAHAVQLVLANDGRIRDASPSPAVAAACVVPGG